MYETRTYRGSTSSSSGKKKKSASGSFEMGIGPQPVTA
jgi:hypothetical protein